MKHNIEENLNIALNHILDDLPQDPFSSMAVKLIECNPSTPTVNRLEAHETYICDATQPSINIDVYLNYQGIERCFHSHEFTYNQSDLDSDNFTWDDKELK